MYPQDLMILLLPRTPSSALPGTLGVGSGIPGLGGAAHCYRIPGTRQCLPELPLLLAILGAGLSLSHLSKIRGPPQGAPRLAGVGGVRVFGIGSRAAGRQAYVCPLP